MAKAMDSGRTAVKPTQLLHFLQLSCHRSPNGDAVIDKSSLLDGLHKFIGKQQERTTIGRRLNRVLQSDQCKVWCVGTGAVEKNNHRYKVEVVRPTFLFYNLHLETMGWVKAVQVLAKAAHDGKLPLDESIVPLTASCSFGEGSQDPQQLDNRQVVVGEGALHANWLDSASAAKRQRIDSGSQLDRSGDCQSAASVAPTLVDSEPSELSAALTQTTETETVATSATSGHGSSSSSSMSTPNARIHEYLKRYSGWSWNDLVKQIAVKDAEINEQKAKVEERNGLISQLKKKVRQHQQKHRRSSTAVQGWKAKAKAKANPRVSSKASGKLDSDCSLEQRMAIERLGHGKRYLTIPARASLAVRRNMSNAACADIGLILLDDASRYTVARAEVHSGSALVAAAQQFHETLLGEMAQNPILSVHMVTEDATNNCIIQKKKLTALILHSAYMVADTNTMESLNAKERFYWNWDNIFNWCRCVGDVQPVEDGNATATMLLTEKMLTSVGCPTVKSLVDIYAQTSVPRTQLFGYDKLALFTMRMRLRLLRLFYLEYRNAAMQNKNSRFRHKNK